MAGCHAQKFPSLIFNTLSTQVTQAVLSCCTGLVQQAKGIYSRIHFFSPLLHTHKNGTDRTAVYSCTIQIPITHTDWLSETHRSIAIVWGGVVGQWVFHLGEGKSCRGTETITPVSTTILLINKTKNISSRDGKFWGFSYFKVHLNFDEA